MTIKVLIVPIKSNLILQFESDLANSLETFETQIRSKYFGTNAIILLPFTPNVMLIQGSHNLWKSWKTWKITKKSSMHGKMEFENPRIIMHGKIMEFCEII